MKGTVTHYDEKRGYCLVNTEKGMVFLPVSVVKAGAYHYLAVGQAVEVDIIPTAFTAVTVSKL